jgi:L-lactate dehydrogenase complex protein LldF
LHLVLLDNGRSRILQDPVARETLKCIRCGCCLNVCPVYKHVGGYAYGWFISGPIGAIFSPQILGMEAARQLPFASSLCGACADVCPVKIPIPKILLHLRQRVVDGDEFENPLSRLDKDRGRAWQGLSLRPGCTVWALASADLPGSAARRLVAGPSPPINRWTAPDLPAFRGVFGSGGPAPARRQDQDRTEQP